jgi:MFS transporter, DHA3 family, macrolide efflux protein
MSTVALAVMVNRLTGSVLQMGGVLAASTLPLVFTAWVGGAFLDRYSSRSLMVAADCVRAVLICAMPFLAQWYIGLVYVLAAFLGIFTGIFNPSQIKLVGEVVPRGHLVKANSYLGVSRDGAELLGYLAGAFIASLAGLHLLGHVFSGWTIAFVVDALSYIASAALLLRLPKVVPKKDSEGAKLSLRALIAESPKVMEVLWRRPVLRTNLLLGAIAMAAIMMNVPISFALAQNVFGRGSLGLGALEVFVAVGLIAGGLVVSRLRLAGDKNGYAFISIAAMAGCYILVGFSPWFWVSMALMGLAGAADIGYVVPSVTMFQEIQSSSNKGRLIAIRSSWAQLGTTAGFVLGGVVGELVGVKPAFVVCGCVTIVVGLLIYVPYRAAASRREREAWTAAMEAGARRSHARELSRQAAYGSIVTSGSGLAGPGLGTATWAAAEAAELNAGSES